jgi:YHS domain-containing protein
MIMRRLSWFTAACLLVTAAVVQAADGEFGKQCTMGLAMQQHIDTDCSINWVGEDGKTYCFGNEDAKTQFLKDPAGNLAKAREFFDAGQK